MNYVMTIMVSLTSQQDYTRCVVGSVKLSLFQTQSKQKKSGKSCCDFGASSCRVRRSLVDALPVECIVVRIVQQVNDFKPGLAALKVG
jgi:hypothetical protein